MQPLNRQFWSAVVISRFFFSSQNLIQMKNNLTTIMLFLGALIWFVIFAADYTYHKDFMTWIHLLASITWWTCGMINFIIKRTSQNGL